MFDTYEQAKSFLKRYRKNQTLVERLQNKLTLANERIYTIKSVGLDDMPKGGIPKTMEDLVADKDDLERRLKRLVDKGLRYKSEVIDLIDEVDDVRYAEILERFFIDCQDLDIIADELGYSSRQIYRIYSEAIYSVMSVTCQ